MGKSINRGINTNVNTIKELIGASTSSAGRAGFPHTEAWLQHTDKEN